MVVHLNCAYGDKEFVCQKSQVLSGIYFCFRKARHFFTIFTISGGMLYIRMSSALTLISSWPAGNLAVLVEKSASFFFTIKP